jgi:thiamine pyrophosphokinase
MAKAVLFTGGEAPRYAECARLIRGDEFIAACDSGFDLARSWGFSPSIVVGDMDSIREPRELDRLHSTSILRYSTDKDESDTEIGLRTLRKMGYDEVSVVGGGGGRLDHLIAILSLFNKRELAPRAWFPGSEAVWLVDGLWEARLVPGSLLSVFPLADIPRSMSSEGLRWSLTGLEWGPGSYGLSNEALEPKVSIRCMSGRLIAVHSLADWRG